MKKKRTYNTRLIKRNRSYTVQGIAVLFQLHENAVRRWVGHGLACIDDQKPQRVRGDMLAAFLNAQQSKRKQPCGALEMYCCKCRKPRPIWENTVDLIILNPKQMNITGLCGECGTPMFKAGSIKKLSEYHKTFNVQTVQGQHLIASSNPPVNCDLEKKE